MQYGMMKAVKKKPAPVTGAEETASAASEASAVVDQKASAAATAADVVVQDTAPGVGMDKGQKVAPIGTGGSSEGKKASTPRGEGESEDEQTRIIIP